MCAKGNKSGPNSINVWKHFTFQIHWCHYCEMHLKLFRCTSALWGIAAHALWLKQASEFSTAKQVSRRSPQDWDPGSICPSPDCEESVPWQILHQLKTNQKKLAPGKQELALRSINQRTNNFSDHKIDTRSIRMVQLTNKWDKPLLLVSHPLLT